MTRFPVLGINMACTCKALTIQQGIEAALALAKGAEEESK